MSKVLVLGGTGFVGSHVVRAFLAAGHEVAVTVRPTSRFEALAGLDLERVPADLHAPESLAAAFRGRDLVVHAAGSLSLWPKASDHLYRTNVLGTRHVVEACLEAGVARLIYDGSVGVYTGSRSPVPHDEAGAPSSLRFRSFHVTSMALGESEVFKGVARGLDAVLLHPSLCFGEGDFSNHSSWPLLTMAMTRMAFAPPGGLNVADVRDVAHAHVLAAEKAPAGGTYLVGGENLTNRAFLDMIQDVLEMQGVNLSPSRLGLKALGRVFELVAQATDQDHGAYVTLNDELAHAMTLYWFVDDSRARRELGYGPSPVRPAMERQVKWLRETGRLPRGPLPIHPRSFFKQFMRAPDRR